MFNIDINILGKSSRHWGAHILFLWFSLKCIICLIAFPSHWELKRFVVLKLVFYFIWLISLNYIILWALWPHTIHKSQISMFLWVVLLHLVFSIKWLFATCLRAFVRFFCDVPSFSDDHLCYLMMWTFFCNFWTCKKKVFLTYAFADVKLNYLFR